MEQTDIGLFIGRLHPLVVHLPIGFLVLAFVMELVTVMPKFKFTVTEPVIRLCLLLSWVAALAAVGCGLLLADSGGYGGDTLFWHKWLGISVAVISFGYWSIKQFTLRIPRNIQLSTLTLLVMLIGGTGHLGGSLTHGENYLTAYAPQFVKAMLGADDEKMRLASLPSPDSAVLFADLVHPIITQKCISCHNDENQSGGLNLVSIEGISTGGDNGEIIDANAPLQSHLFVRVTLPPSSRKFMPPSGEPLSFAEVKILQWWLERGASYDAALLKEPVPEDIQELLERDFGYDVRPKPYLETVMVPSLDSIGYKALEMAGFSVSTLSGKSNLLQVKAKSGFKPDQESRDALLLAKEQITWLDLSASSIEDEYLISINKLSNLTRLRLQENPLGDSGIKYLKSLDHLESINLYGTGVTGETLTVLSELPALQRIYAWKTKITREEVELLNQQRPEILVDLGAESST